ncbi:hypothetical protein QFC21_005012 [Naganishia friedmannii]|uniref:Uncharacterized protein n=1 Tax=Naganishia friedmannii TaxID=89922 RepID=A0ACC2VBR9_9TREE|nr:hypothetical protein QFC21_005012 [Naganishia friedmannii]
MSSGGWFQPFISPVGILVLALIVTRLCWIRKPANVAPWAKSRHYLLGHLLAYIPDPVKFLGEQRRLVGDVIRVDLLIMKVTFLIGADWNRWVLAESDESDVSLYYAVSFFSCGLLARGFQTSGWIYHTLKSIRVGSNGPKRIEEITREFTTTARERFFPEWADQSKIPLFASCFSIFFDSNVTTFFGRRFVDAHGSELKCIFTTMKPALMNPLSRMVPWWASPSGRALKKGSRRMKGIIEAEVVERLRDLDACREGKDYLSSLIIANQTEGYVEDYTEHFSTFIIIAQVNIDATCAWALLHLLRNPEHLMAFEDEVKANPPVDGIYPIENMPFGEACLRETGRLYNNSVMLRYAQHDIQTPSGLILPKGWIATSPVTVQMDPDLYYKPGKWNPRRFLPSTAGEDLHASRFRNYEFVQFGAGKNVCSGIKLTHSLLRTSFWPALLDNYQLEVVPNSIVEGEGTDGVGIMPNHAENLGTAFGVTEPYVKVTKREVPLSSMVHVE